MGPLELTTIFQLINTHRDHTYDLCQNLSTLLAKRDETSLSQYVLTFLQCQGLTTRLLSSHPLLLYGEMGHEDAPTLLCHLHYDPATPTDLQVQSITTILLSLTLYQKILNIRTDISPITLKYLLSSKSNSSMIEHQHGIEQH